MATITKRVHLNTKDGNSARIFDGGQSAFSQNPPNNCETEFDLTKAGITVKSDEKLSVALVKACLPGDLTTFAPLNRGTPDLEFDCIIPNATTPYPNTPTLKIYFTNSEIQTPRNVSPFNEFYLPINCFINAQSLRVLINFIFKTYWEAQSPGTKSPVWNYNNLYNTFIITWDTSLLGAAGFSISPKYYRRPDFNSATHAGVDTYSYNAAKFLQMIGIDPNNQKYEGGIFWTPSNQSVASFGTGNAVMRNSSVFVPPVYIRVSENLDSISSTPGESNIVSQVPVNEAYQNMTVSPGLLAISSDEPVTTEIGHANLDGASSHLLINFNNTNDEFLSFDHSWSLAFTAIELHNDDTGARRVIARRGQNGMYWAQGGSNYGWYFTVTGGAYPHSSNITHSRGINSWFNPPDDSKHLFTYDAPTRKLRWYCDNVLKGTITLTTAEVAESALVGDEPVYIGDAMPGSYYAGNQNMDAHMDDLFFWDEGLVHGSQQVTDYFTEDDHEAAEHAIHLLSYFPLDPPAGESLDITDLVDNATGTHEETTNAVGFITTGTVTGNTTTTPADKYPDMPTPIDAAAINPRDPGEIMFFKGDDYYVYNISTQARVSGPTDIVTDFIGTDTSVSPVKAVVRNNGPTGSDHLYGQLLIYQENGQMTRYDMTSSAPYTTNLGSGFWHSVENWKLWDGASLEHTDGRSYFKNGQVWIGGGRDANPPLYDTGNFVGWQNYGTGTGIFETLPANVDGVWVDGGAVTSNPLEFYVVAGTNYYKLDMTNLTISTTETFGEGGALVETAPGGDDDDQGEDNSDQITGLYMETTSFIEYLNHDLKDSHKMVSSDNITNFKVRATDASNNNQYTDKNIMYEFEFKWHKSRNNNFDMGH